MTPDELATRFPRLFHVCEPGVDASIERLGLLSSEALLDRFEIDEPRRTGLLSTRRPRGVPIHHPVHGNAVLNDNRPLSEKVLHACLDDGLTPAEWLRSLNARVFFWPTERRLSSLLAARVNRARAREVLVFDSHRLLAPCWSAVSLSPINSGSTIRRPARRGRTTFTRACDIGYRDWQRLRGRIDSVAEITVDRAVPHASEALLEVRLVPALQASGVT